MTGEPASAAKLVGSPTAGRLRKGFIMNYKQRCIRGVIIGIVLVAVGFLCGLLSTIFGMRNKFLIVLAFAFSIMGAFFGRRSLRGLMAIVAFDRAKEKELEKLETLFSAGSISQEEYYSRKIGILSAEYDDR